MEAVRGGRGGVESKEGEGVVWTLAEEALMILKIIGQ